VTVPTLATVDQSCDVPRLVAGLRATFASGRTKPLAWRLAQLEGIERLVVDREAEIAGALESDLGRTALDSWLGDVASVRAEAVYAKKHLKNWMKPVSTGLPITQQPGKASYRYEPLGVVLAIGPWNYPVYLTLGPVIGAVAAGNCVIVKPSEHAPATSALLARLIPQYLDRDAIKVVEGEAVVTQDLIAQGLDHVFFTGGPEIGKHILAAAAPHLTPVTLELGGKSPAIISKHADVRVAARRIAWAKFINSGQTCVAPDYVLVDKSVRSTFLDELSASITEQRADAVDKLPIVNQRQFDRLRRLLTDTGGRVVHGGGVDTEALSIEPTIVVDPDPGSDLMQEEVFGPILPVLEIDSFTDAVRFVNARPKPLAAYLFSGNKAEQEALLADVPAGGMVVNHTQMHVLVPQLPFGGVGNSGMGTYHGEWGFQTFSHRKAALVKTTKLDLSIVYPPYSPRAVKLLRKLF
jgi:aldehyde dehydrogenase (NAD+)